MPNENAGSSFDENDVICINIVEPARLLGGNPSDKDIMLAEIITDFPEDVARPIASAMEVRLLSDFYASYAKDSKKLALLDTSPIRPLDWLLGKPEEDWLHPELLPAQDHLEAFTATGEEDGIEERIIVFHPYNLDADSLYNLSVLCKTNKLSLHIDGSSWYFYGWTTKVTITRIKGI